MRSFASWLAVAALSVLAAGCPSGGGGGGGGNHAPVAVDDAATTSEDTPVSVDATANDTDEDDDVIFVVGFTDAANGTVYIDADGTLLYEPDPEFAGTDSFTYDLTDGGDELATATVTVTVSTVGDSPVSIGDDYDAIEDTTLVVSMPALGVLANDGDIDSSPITAVVDSSPQNGDLTLSNDGTFTYDPDANFNGADSFTYHATDGTQSSAAVTVTIIVAPVNDAPVAAADAYNATEDTTLVVNAATGVIGGTGDDTDVDGDTLVAIVSGNPSHGTVVLSADGSFTYTAVADYSGPDSFTYRVWDGHAFSGTVTVTLTIANANDAPAAVADTYSTQEDGGTLSVAAPGVLTNDVDPDGDAVLVAAPYPVGTPSNGVLTMTSDGAFTYTPNANFYGADNFSYNATDGAAAMLTFVSVQVTPVNDPPSFVKGYNVGADEDDAPVSIPNWATSISAGPANEAGQAVTFELAFEDSSFFSVAPAVDGDGTLSFEIAPESSGTTRVSIIAVDDGGTPSNPTDDAHSAAQLFIISVSEINDPPSFDVVTNDVTVNEDSGAYSLNDYAYNLSAGPGESDVFAFFLNQIGVDGTLSFSDGDCSTINCGNPYIDEDGDLTFVPAPNAFGTASYEIQFCDSSLCDVDVLNIHVLPVNDPPAFTAGVPIATFDTDPPQGVYWALNLDPGPNEVDALSFTVTFDDAPDQTLFDAAPEIDPTGLLTFDPAPGFNGDAELTVTLDDDGGTPGLPGDDESSAATPLLIAVRRADAPPGVLYSNLVQNDILSSDEAYGPNGVLYPIVVKFDDANVDCASILVDLTRESAPHGFSTDCSIQGELHIFVDSFTSDADGDALHLDLSNLCDLEVPQNCMFPGSPNLPVFSRSFTYDSEVPSVVAELDPYDCQMNQRALIKWSEPMDVSSTSGFVFRRDSPSQVAITADVTGFGTLDAPNDFFYFVPSGLLQPQAHHVDASGFRDVAGNLGVGPVHDFQTCAPSSGSGPATSTQGLVGLEWRDGAGILLASLPPSSVEDGRVLAPALVDGSDSLDLLVDMSEVMFTVDSVDAYIQRRGPDGFIDQISGSVGWDGSDRWSFENVTWEPGYQYDVHLEIYGGPGHLLVDFDGYVLDPGDVTAPVIGAIGGRRGTGAVPTLHRAEPLLLAISEPVDPPTFDESSFVVTGPQGPIDVTIERRQTATQTSPVYVMRRVDGNGNYVMFDDGLHTVDVSGLLDFGSPQNAMAPVQLTFDVSGVGTTPLLVASTPANGATNVSMGTSLPADAVMLAFNEPMQPSLFRDVGPSNGLDLVEHFTGSSGTTNVPLRGLHAVSPYCCGRTSPEGTEIVRLDFSDFGTTPLLGFRPDSSYTLHLAGGVLANVDGTPLGADTSIAWNTLTGPSSAPLIHTVEFARLVLYPAPFAINGGSADSRFDMNVAVRDRDGDVPSIAIEANDVRTFPMNFGVFDLGFYSVLMLQPDIDAMFPEGAATDFTVRATDGDAQESSVQLSLYRPSTLAAPAVDATGPFPVVSGSINAVDAPFVESVEVIVYEIDESGPVPNAVRTAHSQMAQLSRSGAGATWSAELRDLYLPDPISRVYRVVAVANVPLPRSFGYGVVQAFSPPSSTIAPNAPPVLVTVTGSVADGANAPLSGALVEFAGTPYSTTSDVNGDFSLDVPKSQRGYLRFSSAGRHSVQTLIETTEDLSFGGSIPLQTNAEVQTTYTQIGGPTVDPSRGTVYLFDQSGGLGGQRVDVLGLPYGAYFNDGFGLSVFMNVLAGSGTVEQDFGSCEQISVGNGQSLGSLPESIDVDPSTLTVVLVECN